MINYLKAEKKTMLKYLELTTHSVQKESMCIQILPYNLILFRIKRVENYVLKFKFCLQGILYKSNVKVPSSNDKSPKYLSLIEKYIGV